jgi:hypothetical protein
MNDDEAVVAIIEQERLADPAHIVLALLVEIDARPDPRMDEQIVAKAAAIGEALQEFHMFFGDCMADDRQRLFIRQMSEPGWVHPVTLKAFGTTKPAPLGDELSIAAEDPKQDFLVIAEKEYRFDALPLVGPQALEHLGGGRATVDQVADEDQQGLLGWPALQFRVDFGKQILEQVEAAMNVSHDIGTIAVRAGWPLPSSRRKVEHQDLV